MKVWSGRALFLAAVLACAGILPAQGAGADTSCPAGDPSASSCGTGSADATGPGTLVGAAAPSLTGRALVGRASELEKLLGKPTAVVFWLYTCPHCREAMPILDKLGTNGGGRVVSVALGNNGKGPKGYETPRAAVRTMRLKMPTIQAGRAAFDDWHLQTVPTAFIVDSAGDVTASVQFADTGGPADFVQQVKAELAKAS